MGWMNFFGNRGNRGKAGILGKLGIFGIFCDRQRAPYPQ